MDDTRSSAIVTLSVWHALFLREAISRITSGRVAWLWLFLEPVLHLTVLMMIFSMIQRQVTQGIDFALFLAIGVLGYNLFRNSATRSMAAISANRALFAYRQVKAVDVVLVRAFLEGVVQLLVALLLLAGMALFGFKAIPDDPLGVFVAFALLWLAGTGLGLILSVGSTLVPEIGRLASLCFIPLYFISGVMFPPSMLPPALFELLLWNPILHGLELMRAAFIPGYHLLGGIEVGYLIAFAFASFFFGLAVHRRFASRLLMQ